MGCRATHEATAIPIKSAVIRPGVRVRVLSPAALAFAVHIPASLFGPCERSRGWKSVMCEFADSSLLVFATAILLTVQSGSCDINAYLCELS